jgi:HTH-type transcriptional regulator/antitoxin HigA
VNNKRPAEVFPPGEFIREELEARGWTQADLARIIDRPIQAVNLILGGKKKITARTATELAAAFGTSPELWLNLQSSYSLSQEGGDCSEIEHRAKLYKIAPVKLMETRGWIRKTQSTDALYKELLKFFEVKDLESLPKLPLAARSSAPSTPEVTAAQVTWGFRVRKLAQNLFVSNYNSNSLLPEEVRKVPRILAEMGIRFVIVEHLPKTKMDGCALKIGNAPIIGMSLRYDRIDYFWHTLFHELSHVLNGDIMLDADIEESSIEDAEKATTEARADKQASEMLVPQDKLNSFIARVGPMYSKERINQFANRLHIHPGIIVGQLQHKKEVSFSANREMLVPVRDIIRQEAMTDGWGHFLSVS